MTDHERPASPALNEATPTTIDPRRRFDTWDVDHPSALVHLPSGLRAHVCAFSARAGAFTRFPAGEGVRLGPRTLDGSEVNLTVTHEGTRLGLRFEQVGPDAARMRWWTERTGEWGLRFWVVVALERAVFADPRGGAQVRWQPVDSEAGALGVHWPDGGACVLGARPPLLTTSHADLAALKREYEACGYWYLESRGAAGPVVALRYNLEEMPENCLAIGVGTDVDAARAHAGAALGRETAGASARPRRRVDDSMVPGRQLEAASADEPRGPEPSAASDRHPAPEGRIDLTDPRSPPSPPHSPAPPHSPPPHSPSPPHSPPPHSPSPPHSSPPHSPAPSHPPPPMHSPPPLHSGRYDGALDAIRDVIGWNTVYDPVNRRPYTALSRNWSSSKFGGFGVWLDDVLYHALLAGILDLELAEENLRAVFAGRTEAGNLPCLLTGRDAWVDRSQPPIGAFVLWLLHQRWGERRLLEGAYETLLANHEWWWRERDGNGNGLLEYGTSPVGDGLYRGTALGARNESSMDNSPVHDEAVLVPGPHTLDCEDVGLNSLLVLDGEMLALAAMELGLDADARRLEARTRDLATKIREELWDPEREVFANRLWSGRFVSSIAPTSFYPLIAGAASAAQARALLGWLDDPKRFGGRFALPSVSRDDPACADNVYWRGRIWPPLNFLVYHGLRRYGFAAEATGLARRSYDMFVGPWRDARQCAENYGARDGAITDQPDTDTFYGWGALMPAMAVAEVCDLSPWDGWSITHTGEEVRMGPIRCPHGWALCESRAGVFELHVDGRPVLRTTARGRFRHLRLGERSLSLELPPSGSASRSASRSAPGSAPGFAPGSAPGEQPWLEVPGVPASTVTRSRLDATEGLPITPGSDGARLTIPDRSGRAVLTISWRSGRRG